MNSAAQNPIYYNADQLAYAILSLAARQATSAKRSETAIRDRKEAREWLMSDDALCITQPLGIDEAVQEWGRKGFRLTCPLPRYNKAHDRDWHEYYENKREK